MRFVAIKMLVGDRDKHFALSWALPSLRLQN